LSARTAEFIEAKEGDVEVSMEQSVTERWSIAAGTGLGPVHLCVTDRDRALRFWRDTLGLTLMSEEDGKIHLGAGERELVVLYPGAPRPVPRGTTGLYHLAIHLPSRKELARAVGRLFAQRYPNSPTDHVLTETTYLSDPDYNGIELTFETPERGRFIVTPNGLPAALDADGNFRSVRDPLDLDSLFGELVPGEPLEAPLSEGAKIGHVHLHLADIHDAMRFYRDALGFEELNLLEAMGIGDVNIPGHVPHFIAFNTWAGQGAGQPPEEAAGLRHFTIELPSERDLEETAERLGRGGLRVTEAPGGFFVRDPSANRIHLTVRADVGLP
jgi:catechol 2,3-dioxygenase